MLNFSELNEAQRRAVTHPGGPAIVLAGPGSGKTFLIVNRIIYLIEYEKVSPDTILVITFTKAAALSMQHRFEESTCGKFTGVWFGTFHAFFYQILKEYDSYDNNSLFETEEKKQYLKEIFLQLGLAWERSVDYLTLINNPSLSAPDGITEEQAKEIRQKFSEKIKKDKKLDFDDMADLVISLFEQKPQVLNMVQNKYHYILVDEYQDTNRQQEEILTLLAAPKNELMVVGDEDQSIYGFRESKPEVMKNFKIRYPDAKMYFLEINYRSTKQIVGDAALVINENENRFPKELRTIGQEGEPVRCFGLEESNKEYDYIARRILELKSNYGFDFCEMAVIARTNRELEPLSIFLQKHGIPCSKKGEIKRISSHFIVREILGCLEFITGQRDRAPNIWIKMGGDEKKRRLLMSQMPTSAIHFLCKAMGYEKMLKKYAIQQEKENGVKAMIWMEEWGEVLALIKEHAKGYMVLGQWVTELKEYLENMPQIRQVTGVCLMTMHASKGLEFSYVCIPNVNEGVIPGKQRRKKEEIEEERRLFYVAMTRAKKVLDILYLTGTPEYPRLPSRFLNPLLKKNNYSASSTSSSNSTLSRNSSKASATVSYSSSSSMKISSGSTFGSFSSSR